MANIGKKHPNKHVTHVVELPDIDEVGRMTVLIAQTLRVSGFKDVKAAAPGFRLPRTIQGMNEDHRPSITARTTPGKYVLVDVYDTKMDAAIRASRWQLFSSAAEQSGGQFHLVVAVADVKKAKKLANNAGVHNIVKVWEV